jgi:hypothetical protein
MTTTDIPVNDVKFYPLSMADTSGRLFVWQRHLYRAISQERTALCARLFQDGVIDKLVNKGFLVETERTRLTMSGYRLIVKHRLLPFVSYPYEWSGAMLRDAALLIIDLALQLSDYGLMLQDAHPWNVLFDGPRPVYVDLGSIVESRGNAPWPAYEEFCRLFINPLRLMALGYGRIARWLLHDLDKGICYSDLPALGTCAQFRVVRERTKSLASKLKATIPPRLQRAIRRSMSFGSVSRRPLTGGLAPGRGLLNQVRRSVEKIRIPRRTTQWSEYYGGAWRHFNPSDGWTAKEHSVYSILSQLRPTSLLDVGSNRGWYSGLAASRGIEVVAFDSDETCINDLFWYAKSRNLTILPIVMDFKKPSPGIGFDSQWGAPATERFKCDMVVCLALVHHLVFGCHLNFDQIVGGLSAFANKWLLVEFVLPEDAYVRKWSPGSRPWYALAPFQRALERQYRIVRMVPSSPATRILLLCER